MKVDPVAKVSRSASELFTRFGKEVAAKGEGAVLYDLPRSSETCGARLQ